MNPITEVPQQHCNLLHAALQYRLHLKPLFGQPSTLDVMHHYYKLSTFCDRCLWMSDLLQLSVISNLSNDPRRGEILLNYSNPFNNFVKAYFTWQFAKQKTCPPRL